VSKEEHITHWKKIFDRPDQSIVAALSKGFPTAIWKLPGQNTLMALIDLSAALHPTAEEIESLEPGFVFNTFDKHHPSEPTLLKADLLFTWEMDHEEDYQLRLSPTLSSSQMDAFLSAEEQKTIIKPANASIADHHAFEEMVQKAVEEIRSQHFAKVVLSRYEDTDLPQGFDLLDFFQKACHQYPNAFCYIAHTHTHGTWMGATPETFISHDENGLFQTMSLAGTQKLEDRSLEDIAWTQKDIEEQALVSRYIIDCFKKIRLREFEEIGPRTAKAGNLVHLKTNYTVDTTSLHIDNLSTTMMNLLHPTSAVCGMPLAPALAFIKDNEQYDRSLYSGFLGPVNIDQRTHLFVNLRCMQLIGDHQARLYAGAGITADSHPQKELVETQLKMNTLKKLFEA
jgi:isochorismate synthase